MSRTEWFDVPSLFCESDWSEFRAGDILYYTIPGRRSDEYMHGPFTVVDPSIGRLRNQQGVELNLPRVQPWKMLPTEPTPPKVRTKTEID